MKRVVFLCLFVGFAVPVRGGWTHVEYGFGNYGEGDPAAIGLRLLRPADHPPTTMNRRRTAAQFQRFFEALEARIQQRGPEGTVYLNDRETVWLRYGKERVQEWLAARGYRRIQLVALPGDFETLTPPRSDTATLRNPDGDLLLRARTPAVLAKMAGRSATGLELITFEWEKMGRLMHRGLVFTLEAFDVPPYLYPDGEAVALPHFAFRIPQQSPCPLEATIVPESRR